MLRCIMVLGCTLVLAVSAYAQPQGRAIFEGKGNCWTCHGKNGTGTPLGPNLTDDEWLDIDGSLDSIRAVIQRGVTKPRKYPAPMPAQGGAKLSTAEIDAVAAYVHALRIGGGTHPGAQLSLPCGRLRRCGQRSAASAGSRSPT